ncbi:response regulator [Actinoplanes auranticolor]|uniref:response regulator n=1 Tax=Actinoplanes auranticolor TaxID=47988 RepID=UPI0034DB3C74
MRSGLRVPLSAEPGLGVVGEAGDGAAAVDRCAAGDVDVVLMDVWMVGTDGIEATRGITAQSEIGARVLVVTTPTTSGRYRLLKRSPVVGTTTKKHHAPETSWPP